MKKQTCKSCKYFKENKESKALGDCKRYPHYCFNNKMVAVDEWCGEYKLNK